MLTRTQKRRMSEILAELEEIAEDVEEIHLSREALLERKSETWRTTDEGSAVQDGAISLGHVLRSVQSAISSIGDLELGED